MAFVVKNIQESCTGCGISSSFPNVRLGSYYSTKKCGSLENIILLQCYENWQRCLSILRVVSLQYCLLDGELAANNGINSQAMPFSTQQRWGETARYNQNSRMAIFLLQPLKKVYHANFLFAFMSVPVHRLKRLVFGSQNFKGPLLKSF